MSKIKVGYLPLYIKLYDDSNPKTREPLEKYMHTLISMIEGEDIEVIPAPVCRIKPEFDAAAKMFNEQDVDAVITQHLAYSPSLESIEALLSIKAPLIVFDTTPDYDLLGTAGYKRLITPNHGIHGVQDMCNLLRQRGRDFQICVGHALHSEVVSEVAGMCRAAKVKKAFTTARVGTVGGSFTGMGDFFITPENYKARIGAEVFEFDKKAVAKYLKKVTEAEIDAEIEADKEIFDFKFTNVENYRLAVKSGLAIRKWMEDNKLDSCTVNFLTLDICGLPKMPFHECCKMLMKGKGYAGEGDVLTAGLVGAFRSVYPNTTFTEMFCPDWKNDVLLMSHMGEMNMSLAKWKPALYDKPFNYNSCGDTVGSVGCMREGSAVLVNLAPMGEGFTMIVTPVEMLDKGLEFGIYKDEIQGWLKPCMPIKDFLKAYSLIGGTHHSALVYDADIAEIEAFGKMMGFKVEVIK